MARDHQKRAKKTLRWSDLARFFPQCCTFAISRCLIASPHATRNTQHASNRARASTRSRRCPCSWKAPYKHKTILKQPPLRYHYCTGCVIVGFRTSSRVFPLTCLPVWLQACQPHQSPRRWEHIRPPSRVWFARWPVPASSNGFLNCIRHTAAAWQAPPHQWH